jgi:hypothetical protein
MLAMQRSHLVVCGRGDRGFDLLHGGIVCVMAVKETQPAKLLVLGGGAVMKGVHHDMKPTPHASESKVSTVLSCSMWAGSLSTPLFRPPIQAGKRNSATFPELRSSLVCVRVFDMHLMPMTRSCWCDSNMMMHRKDVSRRRKSWMP